MIYHHIVARGHGSYSSLNIPLNKIVVPSDRLVSGSVERHQQPSIYIYICCICIVYISYVLYITYNILYSFIIYYICNTCNYFYIYIYTVYILPDSEKKIHGGVP